VNADPLDSLVGRLNKGDFAAAEELVHTYEPYLRLVVRRSLPSPLRAKFDSVDVVQSVWVHLLHGLRETTWEFPDRAHLLALLVTITRRRLVSRIRHHRTALDRNEPRPDALDRLAAPRQSRPSEVVRAEELWARMLALCPPGHQELLHLKRQGLTLLEIASRTGLHEGSVRRILRRLSRQLALESEPQVCSHSHES
jgi:RNA polymerase sigma factor (sigma-70 family)